MKLAELKIVTSVLRKQVGWSWLLFLMKSLFRNRSLFQKTRWSKVDGPEAKFVKRFSFAAALFLELQTKLGEDKAFAIMKRILVPIGSNEQWGHLQSLMRGAETPMEWLMVFNDLMDQKGAPRFNTREYLQQDDTVCHFLITRCVFQDFFTEAGAPSLTTLFCEVDREFFPKAFPELSFHRGGSWENTIAFGKDHCEFIFEVKE